MENTEKNSVNNRGDYTYNHQFADLQAHNLVTEDSNTQIITPQLDISVHSDVKTSLQASFYLFLRYFFKVLTGRDFALSNPLGRESHFITLCRELVRVYRNPNSRLNINLPPGYGKTTLLSFWIAWCFARWHGCQFIYISYGISTAALATEQVRRIIQLKEFKEIFGVYVCQDDRGKEKFSVGYPGSNFRGVLAGFGSSGPITGKNGGLPQMELFSGAVVIDDAHKPDEAHSDTIRESIIRNYHETIYQRPRGINVPIINLGQRVHELDLSGHLMGGGDGRDWWSVILKALDDVGNALYPEKDPLQALLIKKEKDPYTFYSQFQQEPQPAGGSLFKRDNFPLLDVEPEIVASFITCDTAETSSNFNDASVFSFWGVYKLDDYGHETDMWGLHWLDCYEIRVEPHQLKEEFIGFVNRCYMHPIKPRFAAIEKKSTGVTLLSVMSEMQGLEIRPIERNAYSVRDGKRISQNKSERFISMQHYIAGRQVSLPSRARHTGPVLEHMRKITANETHAFDDICDTCYDAVKYVFMDKALLASLKSNPSQIGKKLAQDLRAQRKAREAAYYGNFL